MKFLQIMIKTIFILSTLYSWISWAQDGKGKFVQSCQACHGEHAQGIVEKKAPNLRGQESWYLDKVYSDFTSGARKSKYSPTCALITNAPNKEDFKDIINFIANVSKVPLKSKENAK